MYFYCNKLSDTAHIGAHTYGELYGVVTSDLVSSHVSY